MDIIRKSPTQIGFIYQSSGQYGVSVRTEAVALLHAADVIMNTVNRAFDYYSDLVAPNEAAKAAAVQSRQLKVILAELQTVNRSLAERFARLDAPAALTDAIWENRYIAGLRAMDASQRMEALSRDIDLARSSALVRYDDVLELGLPDQLIAAIRERHRLLMTAAMTGVRARFAVKPSLDNPLASGVDETAMLEDVAVKLQQMQDEQDGLELDGRALVDLLRMIAGITNQKVEDLWKAVA